MSRWACARYAPAATAVQAVKSSAHQAQPLSTSAAVPLVKQTAWASSCSVAHTGMYSPGRCPSNGRWGLVLYNVHDGTDTKGRYTQHESHSGASSAVSLWRSWRYLLQVDSAGLLYSQTGSFLHQQRIVPELQLRDDSKTEDVTEKLVSLQ